MITNTMHGLNNIKISILVFIFEIRVYSTGIDVCMCGSDIISITPYFPCELQVYIPKVELGTLPQLLTRDCCRVKFQFCFHPHPSAANFHITFTELCEHKLLTLITWRKNVTSLSALRLVYK